jgi:hypothetical protein
MLVKLFARLRQVEMSGGVQKPLFGLNILLHATIRLTVKRGP